MVLNLPIKQPAYLNIESFAVPDVNTIASWTNNTYATFTSSNANITSAISASGTVSAETAVFNVVAGRYYQVTAFLTVNSGQVPNLGIYNGAGSLFDYGPTALVAGFNTITYRASVTGALAKIIVQNTAATNFNLNTKFVEITF